MRMNSISFYYPLLFKLKVVIYQLVLSLIYEREILHYF